VQERRHPKVILIGGAPMIGKSTLARKLAAQLEYGCLSTDDLGQAIGAVTTVQSHLALHEMDGIDYREYYITRSVDDLIADAERRHAALWPAITQVITGHATWGYPVVVEGWALYPSRVAQLAFPNSTSLWLVADDEVLEARVRSAVAFYRGASDEEAMIRHFKARSRWHNRRIQEEATVLGFPVIPVALNTTAESLRAQCTDILDERGGTE
jgi:2-phosphoglycerate kinase